MTKEQMKVSNLLNEARNNILDAMYEDTMHKTVLSLEDFKKLDEAEEIISSIVTNILKKAGEF